MFSAVRIPQANTTFIHAIRGIKFKYKWDRPGTKDRQLMEQLSVPILHPRLTQKTMSERCAEKRANRDRLRNKVTPFKEFVKKKTMEYLSSSTFFGVFHKGMMSGNQYCEVKFQLEEDVLKDSKFQNLQVLWDTYLHSSFVMSSEADPDIKKMLKIMQKEPQFILLAAYCEGRLLSRGALIRYSQLPNLDILRSQTVSILSHCLAGPLQSITASQQRLSSNLTQYVNEIS